MKLKYAQKMLILSIIFFVIILVSNIVFAELLLGKIFDINDKVRQLNISSQERENELNLKDSIGTSKTEREKLNAYFIASGDLPALDFTKYLENLAKDAGVTQTKTLAYEALAGLPTSDIVTSIHYKFTVTGHWANVSSFLQAVENLPNVLSVGGVSLSVNPESQIWSADLDFSVASLKN